MTQIHSINSDENVVELINTVAAACGSESCWQSRSAKVNEYKDVLDYTIEYVVIEETKEPGIWGTRWGIENPFHESIVSRCVQRVIRKLAREVERSKTEKDIELRSARDKDRLENEVTIKELSGYPAMLIDVKNIEDYENDADFGLKKFASLAAYFQATPIASLEDEMQFDRLKFCCNSIAIKLNTYRTHMQLIERAEKLHDVSEMRAVAQKFEKTIIENQDVQTCVKLILTLPFFSFFVRDEFAEILAASETHVARERVAEKQ